MIFLFHVDDEPAVCRIDNKTIAIPPHELFEVPEIRGTDTNNNGPQEYITPAHQVAKLVIAHCWYNGIVEVPILKTKTGLTADVPAAEALAKKALSKAQDLILTKYVQDQQERVTQYNKPAIAPNGRVKTIIEKRGIDLKKEFNIDPPGYVVEKVQDRDAEMATLRSQNEAMQRQMAQILKQLGEKKGA